MIVNKSLYPVSSNMRSISNMQRQLENLQLQLATGKRYNTLAEMGNDRLHDLNIRARLGRIEGYKANILTVETRLSFYTNSIQRLDEIEADARALAVPGAYGTDGINFLNVRNQSTALLKEVIDVLNTDITGQYIFGGNASDRRPVASFDEIMYGANGFQQYVQNRAGLDGVGTGGNVDIAAAGGVVTIGESTSDDHGFKLGAPTTTSGAVAIASTAADPAEYEISFTDQPQPGDKITIAVTSPHDRGPEAVKYYTFTVAHPDDYPEPASPGDPDPLPSSSFRLGATPEETAANFAAQLEGKLQDLSETDLRSSSTYRAADDFFESNGQEPGTTEWYRGQNSDNPRQTVSANIDEHTKAHYGVQANEHGFVELIKGLAVFAVSEDMTDLNDVNAKRYDAMVSIQRGRLSEINNSKPGSIEGIAMDLGIAASTINTVKTRHTQYDAQLQTMLAEIEGAPREEVAMMLLTLQVQLQASYQATAMASQLTLVNYLR